MIYAEIFNTPFLLHVICSSEKDVKDLLSASFSYVDPISGKPCTAVVLLTSSVKDTAFKKYGDTDGLAAEFANRKTKAVLRYTLSQDTEKPQKKRPKIENASDRPGDHLKQLSYWVQTIPTCVAFSKRDGGVPNDWSIKCKHCA